MATIEQDQSAEKSPPSDRVTAYAIYALILLILATILNYLDRYILSILAQSIKADLKLDDTQLGFLMGTAFAVFYAIVGIAMGRISDGVKRKNLMALGLAIWSSMTAFGGAATSFLQLSVARFGVGIGEATANPCSHSLVADTFPQRHRAIALSFVVSGTFMGTALSMIIGGMFLQHWKNFCGAVPIAGSCEVASWKAALIAVGLPGIPLAVLIAFLREPPRKQEPQKNVGKFVASEFAASVPPFTLFTLYRLGGMPALTRNLALVAIITVLAAIIGRLTGDYAQWIATGVGAYAIFTWGAVQSHRDRPLFKLTFGDRTFMLGVLASAAVACIGGSVQTWAAPYAMRVLHLSPLTTGVSLGLIFSVGAVLGVIFGGWLTDRWKTRDKGAPMWVASISLLGGLPSIVVLLLTKDPSVFMAACFCFSTFGSLWGGAFAAMVQDLVLPRMRGAAASAFSLVSIVIASGAGPYWVGKVSTVTGSLKIGLLSMEALLPVALVLLWLTARRLRKETPETRLARAREAGEPA